MKPFFTVFLFFAVISTTVAQSNTTWEKWSWLIGDWKGEGDGNPGKGQGVFSFHPDLGEKILVRKSHSTYSTHGKTVHDDLMIIYNDRPDFPVKAIYFDNEGHTINYNIAYMGKSIVFTSNKVQDVPFFRLSYTELDSETVNTKFEMSQDGAHFTTYVEGKSKKVK